MSSPYREVPAFMVCPRCEDTLDHVLEGTHACPRCQGLWIASFVLDVAFGNPKWPGGRALWWRNELPCPECGRDGKPTILEARSVDDVVVDHCSQHGVWLDAGELGRLVGAEGTGSAELGELQRRVAANSGNVDELRKRREQWRRQVAASRQQVGQYRAQVEDAHRQRIERADQRDATYAAAAVSEPAVKKLLASQQPERLKTLESIATLELELATLNEQQARILAQIATRKSQLATATAHYTRLDEALAAAKRGAP